MPGFADANLVLALLDPDDALHARARRHAASSGRLFVPYSVGIELLLVARKRSIPALRMMSLVCAAFDVEKQETLVAAADALDSGAVATPLDAVHLADSFHSGERLHTADRRLQKTRFPTVPW